VKTCIKLNPNDDKSFLTLCSNITSLDITGTRLSVDITSVQHLVNQLKKFRFDYGLKGDKRIDILLENNKNSLKSIEVSFDRSSRYMTSDDVKPLFIGLSKLSKLTTLSMSFDSEIENSFMDYFVEIANKCQNLLSIDLRFYSENPEVIQNVLNTIKFVKYLKHFKLRSYDMNDTEFDFNYESLKECQNLTHLTIFNLRIKDNFFIDIDKKLPKLQSIYITKANEITFETLNELSKLKDIQEIYIKTNETKTSINESDVMKVIENCRKINSIYFRNYKKLKIKLNSEHIYRLRASGVQNSGVRVIQENYKEMKTLKIIKDLIESDFV